MGYPSGFSASPHRQGVLLPVAALLGALFALLGGASAGEAAVPMQGVAGTPAVFSRLVGADAVAAVLHYRAAGTRAYRRIELPVEDGREFEVTGFEEHSDGRIRFRFPEIPGADPVDGAWFSFVVGPARAGPVWVGRIERLPSPGRSREGETMETGTGLRLPATGPSVEPLPPGATGVPPGPLPDPGPGGGKKNPIQ